LDKPADLVSSLSEAAEHLTSLARGFGGGVLVAVLLVPILVALSTRQVMPAVAATLLSLVSLMLFMAPASASNTLAIASALGSFLVALHSAIGQRRAISVGKQIAEVASRLDQLENAVQRRLLSDLRRRQSVDQPEPTPGPRDESPPHNPDER
jgi:hypothetical protein